MCPFVGYGGEIDPQLQASKNMQEQLLKEGVNLENLRASFWSAPAWGTSGIRRCTRSRRSSSRRRWRRASTPPAHVRFVTYTTRFNRAFWITVEELDRHYQRAEVDANRESARTMVTTKNVARLRVEGPGPLTLDGQEFREYRRVCPGEREVGQGRVLSRGSTSTTRCRDRWTTPSSIPSFVCGPPEPARRPRSMDSPRSTGCRRTSRNGCAASRA